MTESKVLNNNVREYHIVKVNELFASGFEVNRNSGIKLSQLEFDASRYTLEQAQKVTELIGGKITKVVEVEIKTRTYKDIE